MGENLLIYYKKGQLSHSYS